MTTFTLSQLKQELIRRQNTQNWRTKKTEQTLTQGISSIPSSLPPLTEEDFQREFIKSEEERRRKLGLDLELPGLSKPTPLLAQTETMPVLTETGRPSGYTPEQESIWRQRQVPLKTVKKTGEQIGEGILRDLDLIMTPYKMVAEPLGVFLLDALSNIYGDI